MALDLLCEGVEGMRSAAASFWEYGMEEKVRTRGTEVEWTERTERQRDREKEKKNEGVGQGFEGPIQG